jgi:predicted metal-dependent hydrolase
MQKSIYVDSIGTEVIISRRRGTRSLRLAVRSDGTIKITVPYTVSEKQAIKFLEQKSDWIAKHHKKPTLLEHGAHIGKSHMLYFDVSDTDKIRTRLTANKITVRLTKNIAWDSQLAQGAARKASEKALKAEASNLLPQRLTYLAKQKDITYKSCSVKKLKSRWGSCDSANNIILNIYLIQLEWELIDYVILHELAHTNFKHHQTGFWDFLSVLLPDYKVRRKQLKQMPTDILPTSF